MKLKLKGFVIFAVLLLLQMCSLFELYTLQFTARMLKQSDFFWQRLIALSSTQTLLSQIENMLITTQPWCKVPVLSAKTIANESLDWWMMHACAGNFLKIRYYYVVESLGKDACSVVENGNAALAATTDYYRITLLAFPDDSKSAKIILQTIVTLLSKLVLSCHESWHVVKLGRQMWREI